MLVTRLSARLVMAAGMIFVGAGILWATQVPAHGHFWANLAGPLFLAGGAAFLFTPLPLPPLPPAPHPAPPIPPALPPPLPQRGPPPQRRRPPPPQATEKEIVIMVTIEDKTVLVTGANRGIGQALVAEALARGATRVYAGTRQPLAHPDPRITPVTLDVTSAAQIQAAADQIESLDILVNNAGVEQADDLGDRAALAWPLAVNFFGTYAMTQAFL